MLGPKNEGKPKKSRLKHEKKVTRFFHVLQKVDQVFKSCYKIFRHLKSYGPKSVVKQVEKRIVALQHSPCTTLILFKTDFHVIKKWIRDAQPMIINFT